MEKDSELSVHFYIKNIGSSHPKNEIYKQLYDAIQNYGEVKEISLQKFSNDVYDLGVGMKHDEDAQYLIQKNKLHSFVSSLETNDDKPFLEISFMFNFYLKNLNERHNHDPKKEGKYSASSYDSQRRNNDAENQYISILTCINMTAERMIETIKTETLREIEKRRVLTKKG